MSAIVELLIAGALTLPELLHVRAPAVAEREEKPAPADEFAAPVAPKPRLASEQTPAFSVADYIGERIVACKGGMLAFRDVYRDYETTALRHAKLALAPDQFAASLDKLCEGTSVATARDDAERTKP